MSRTRGRKGVMEGKCDRLGERSDVSDPSNASGPLEKGEGVRGQEERNKAWEGDPTNIEFVIPSKSVE